MARPTTNRGTREPPHRSQSSPASADCWSANQVRNRSIAATAAAAASAVVPSTWAIRSICSGGRRFARSRCRTTPPYRDGCERLGLPDGDHQRVQLRVQLRGEVGFRGYLVTSTSRHALRCSRPMLRRRSAAASGDRSTSAATLARSRAAPLRCSCRATRAARPAAGRPSRSRRAIPRHARESMRGSGSAKLCAARLADARAALPAHHDSDVALRRAALGGATARRTSHRGGPRRRCPHRNACYRGASSGRHIEREHFEGIVHVYAWTAVSVANLA